MPIRDIELKSDSSGRVHTVRVVFGPHYFLEIVDDKGKASLSIGATHHGIRAAAHEVNGELEQFVNELRERHPSNRID